MYEGLTRPLRRISKNITIERPGIRLLDEEYQMTKTRKLLMTGLLAGAFLSPVIFSSPAQAQGYCREYQKTIRVGNRMESGYGTACMQPDGSWMIVDASGNVDPFDELVSQNVSLVAQEQPVYFPYGRYYRPVTYYAPVRYRYYRQPAYVFSFGYRDNDWNHRWRNRDWDRGNHRGWDHRDWDHDDHDRGRRGHH